MSSVLIEESSATKARAASAVSVAESSDWGVKVWRGCKPVRRLGKGLGAEVWLVRTRAGKQAVDKCIAIEKDAVDSERSTIGAVETDDFLFEKAKREIEFLRSLEHPHVVQLYDAWIDEAQFK